MANTPNKPKLRKRPTRKAKEKASLEITKYFKPKSLQKIPEDAEVVYTKASSNDKNNNCTTKAKRNFEQSQKGSKSDEKVLKVKKTKPNSSKSNETKQSSKQNGLKQSSVESPSKGHSSSDSSNSSLSEIILLDSPVLSKSLIVIDSSITSNESVYDFDALQTDDSTDEEIDVELANTKKPYWSLYKNRIAIVTDQTDVKTKVIDKLFGSGPETVNSTDIFPFIKPIQRRRSTAIWNTPPRYSILPKY